MAARLRCSKSGALPQVHALGQLVARSHLIIDVAVDALVDAVDADRPDVGASPTVIGGASAPHPIAAPRRGTV